MKNIFRLLADISGLWKRILLVYKTDPQNLEVDHAEAPILLGGWHPLPFLAEWMWRA
jgi:hypothetical protein